MRQWGKALRDCLPSWDTAPIRLSDVMGNAMEFSRGDRVAYRLWGIIVDSRHAYADTLSVMCLMTAAERTQQTRWMR